MSRRIPGASGRRNRQQRFPGWGFWSAVILAVVAGLTLAWYQSGQNAADTARGTTPLPSLETVLGHAVETQINLGEGLMLAVVMESPESREVVLLRWDGAGSLTVADRLTLPLRGGGLEVRRQALPGHPDAVVLTTRLAKGEPQHGAVALTPAGIEALDYYALVAPAAPVSHGPALLVNKRLNVLYLYRDGALVRSYRVATGAQTTGPAPTWQDYATNLFTPEGQFTVDLKQVNPVYYGSQSHPPAPGGAPENPLGTRWLGFRVLGPDDPATIWGIHGTNEPDSIGAWASDGCIRLRTPEVEELFDQVPEGTPLFIIPG